MSNPFFSIIIPVYNVEKYLRECLDSVLRQSFSDYEIVLVDDGSRDHSEYIYKAYAMKYADKVTIFRKQNEGPFLQEKTELNELVADIISSLILMTCCGVMH